MSYNKDVVKACKIRIVTKTEGEENVFQAVGTLSAENGETVVRYLQKGDRVTLRISQSEFCMRRDSLCSMRFRPDETTEAKLTFGPDSEGECSVFTSLYSLSFPRCGEISLSLDYELRFSAEIAFFSLKILIQFISED